MAFISFIFFKISEFWKAVASIEEVLDYEVLHLMILYYDNKL